MNYDSGTLLRIHFQTYAFTSATGYDRCGVLSSDDIVIYVGPQNSTGMMRIFVITCYGPVWINPTSCWCIMLQNGEEFDEINHILYSGADLL